MAICYTSKKRLIEFVYLPFPSPHYSPVTLTFVLLLPSHPSQQGFVWSSEPNARECLQVSQKWYETHHQWRIDEYLADLKDKRPRTQEPWRPGAKVNQWRCQEEQNKHNIDPSSHSFVTWVPWPLGDVLNLPPPRFHLVEDNGEEVKLWKAKGTI